MTTALTESLADDAMTVDPSFRPLQPDFDGFASLRFCLVLAAGQPKDTPPAKKACAKEPEMSVRLKIENSSAGLVATISQRDDAGKVVGAPSVSLVDTKEEAKQQAKALARSLGLKVYGIVDKSETAELSPARPAPDGEPG